MHNLSPTELKALLEANSVVLLDVRQPDEVAIAALPGSIHIPLDQLPARLGELDPAQAVVVLCHHGVRSEIGGRLLESSGFASVAHLSGGIDAWSQSIDPSLPRY